MRTFILVVAIACSGKSGGPATTTTNANGSAASAGSGSASSGSAKELVGVGAALDVTPAEASVTIDDIAMGKAVELAPVIALQPGLHTLVISQAGFKTYRVEFAVTDKVEKFTVKLEQAK